MNKIVKRSLLGMVLAFGFFVFPSMGADRWTIGLTSSNTRIEAAAIDGPSTASPTVLLIGGLHGNDETVHVVSQEAVSFEALSQTRRPFRLLAIPLANPDGVPLQFPPAGVAYKQNIESHV